MGEDRTELGDGGPGLSEDRKVKSQLTMNNNQAKGEAASQIPARESERSVDTTDCGSGNSAVSLQNKRNSGQSSILRSFLSYLWLGDA